MKIETKFNICDEVCYLHENQITNATIQRFLITYNKFGIHIQYGLDDHMYIEETLLFRTEQELLDSL